MHNFREMKIRNESVELVKMVYQVSATLPLAEKFGLRSQMNRSAVSIPSNIAEGSGRSTNKDFKNVINIAMSSSYELETQLILANDLFDSEVDNVIKKLNELQKMTAGFKRTLS